MPLVEGTLLQMEPKKKDSSMGIESLPVVPELIFPPKIVLGIINLAAGLSPPIGRIFLPPNQVKRWADEITSIWDVTDTAAEMEGQLFWGRLSGEGGFSIVVWYGLVWWVCWQEKESAINWENDQTATRKIAVEIESRLGANADDWDGIKRV